MRTRAPARSQLEALQQGRNRERRKSIAMTWRPWLLALCALGLILIVANAVTDLTVNGSFGLSGTPTAIAFVDRLEPRPGGAAAESGIRAGDLLDRRRLSPAARFRLYYGARLGEPLALRS